MNLILAAAVLVVAAIASPALAQAEDVPCEDMLSDLRAALEVTKLSDADAAKVNELEEKGIERCNADDDARADEFFRQAMQIVGQ